MALYTSYCLSISHGSRPGIEVDPWEFHSCRSQNVEVEF